MSFILLNFFFIKKKVKILNFLIFALIQKNKIFDKQFLLIILNFLKYEMQKMFHLTR